MFSGEREGYSLPGREESLGTAAEDVLERVFEATGTASLVELADWLGTRQALLSDFKRTGRMQADWLRVLVMKRPGYNPEWILTGKGDKFSGCAHS